MEKPFYNLEQQIALIKERGMQINNDEYTKEFLLRKNYYNTINVYGRYFFQENKINVYVDESKFDEIKNLYYFDKNLRDLVMKKILEVEANLKSTIAYYFSKNHPNKNSYKEETSYNLKDTKGRLSHIRKSDFEYLQKEFQKTINKNSKTKTSNIKSIYHNTRVRGYVPFWVLVNYMTFGQLVVFVNLQSIDVQTEISRSFSEGISKSYGEQVNFNPVDLINFMEVLKDLRNRVAHDNTLLFYSSRFYPRYQQFIHGKRNMSRSYISSNNTFLNSLLCIQMFLSKSNYQKTEKQISNMVEELHDNIKSISINNILKELGIIGNWKLYE